MRLSWLHDGCFNFAALRSDRHLRTSCESINISKKRRDVMAVDFAPRQRTRARLVGLALSLFAMLTVQQLQAADASDYFRGKTIKIYVGYGPGGGNDITARVFAEF